MKFFGGKNRRELINLARKKIKNNRFFIFLLFCSLASQQLTANPTYFHPAHQIQYQPILLKPKVPITTLQTGNTAALEKAYQKYLQTGKAPNIIQDGFVQFAYGAQQPIIPASPFELTCISLEAGENVLSVSCGDPMRWSYSLVYSGEKMKEPHVLIKPSQSNISTDLVITTSKRFYTLKLVSKQSHNYYRDVRFWYPDTIDQTVDQSLKRTAGQLIEGDSPNPLENRLDLSNLNFNYQIKFKFFDSKPTWTPSRIFDDGHQTYIQFPDSISQTDLPALFVKTNTQMQMTNYRVKSPYLIVDHVFDEALLISGSGKTAQKLTLINQGRK